MALEPKPLDLRISPVAREQIQRFIAATERTDAIATLMVDVNKRWSIGAYYRENIEGLTPQYRENGWPLLHSCGGMTIAIPQFDVLPVLIGRTLDHTADGYVVR